jgi:RNA polymerase sigma factor (sigma-70 family)
MRNGQLGSVFHHVRKLVTERAGPSADRVLLERFVRDHDEAAFAALVERHGPMVLGVCRRVLRHQHDAEDACQATFLVLARRAASIRNRDNLGSWLHGVAFRAAAGLRRRIARRRAREGPEADVPQADAADVTWREVRGIFDEELRRLPARFQAPLLLCYLEGKTRDEAAQELGWSLGTLRGRLERGRELLRGRLVRRGVTLSGALLAALLSGRAASAALPAALVVRILRTVADAGAVPAPVAALLEEVSRAMLLSRLKVVAAVSLGVCLLGLGVALRVGGALEAQPPAAPPGAGDAAERTVPPSNRPPAAGRAEEAGMSRDAAASRENLKQLVLAMHNYMDTYGHFPAPAIYAGPAGRASGMGSSMGAGVGGGAGAAMPGSGGGSAAGSFAPPGGAPAAGAAPGGSFPPPGGAPTAGAAQGGSGSPTLAPAGPGGAGPTPPPLMGSGSFRRGARPNVGSGKALLSWRVALLPYLEQQELYRQFKLDEPWDSPHNKKLLAKMPKVFAAPGVTTREPYTTFYQVFVGPHAAFEKHRAMRIANITDGTSNTLLIVEAGSAVPWTKPEDLHFDEDEPLPELGGAYPGIFNAAFADGSVHVFRKNANPDLLRALITRDGGEPVDPARIEAPTSRREVELRRQNERLKQELDQEKKRLEALRQEKEALSGGPEDPRVAELRMANARLEEQLNRSRKEAEALQEEIRRLKQAQEKRSGKGPGN